MENKKFIVTSVITNLIIVLVAVLGSVFVALGMDWYSTLIKPTQWPPGFLFGVVWTVIYVLTAITLFIWQKHSKVPTAVYVVFVLFHIKFIISFGNCNYFKFNSSILVDY